MSFECEYCSKMYSSKSSLNYHQKTTKSCLKIQETLKPKEEINSITYDCKYCKKQFSTNQRLTKHTLICIDKYKFELNQKNIENFHLKEEIEILKDKIKTVRLEVENEFYKNQSKENQSTINEIVKESQSTINEIAKQPRVQTNTNNNNKIMIAAPMDMSYGAINQAIQSNFSDEYLIQGQKGAARFAYDNILKDEQGKLKYICTDAARQIFQYKNEEGKVQKDVRATKLAKALLDGEIKQAYHKIACEKMAGGGDMEFQAFTNNYYEIKDMEEDNSEFSKELTSLTA